MKFLENSLIKSLQNMQDSYMNFKPYKELQKRRNA